MHAARYVRLAIVLVILSLAACSQAASEAAATPSPTRTPSPTATATFPPIPTLTPTLAPPTFAPVPPPTNVPAGWKVLSGFHFSLAYPSTWSVSIQTNSPTSIDFSLVPPTPSPLGVSIEANQLTTSQGSEDMAPYCFGPGQVGVGRVTLAGLSVAFQSGQGESGQMRSWAYVNTQRTEYLLSTGDTDASSSIRAANDSILATFRPDVAQPWTC